MEKLGAFIPKFDPVNYVPISPINVLIVKPKLKLPFDSYFEIGFQSML